MPKILITSGPTRQYLDPIRYLTNASSGRTGAALAGAALARGWEVVIISGPVTLRYPEGAKVVPVISTEEMLERAKEFFPECDGVIGVAAPCDYRPIHVAKNKLSKIDFTQAEGSEGELLLKLIETPDIMASLAAIRRKARPQWMVAFALETKDHRVHALQKLQRKSCDLIVLNDQSVIDNEMTRVEILNKVGETAAVLNGSKTEVAVGILDVISNNFYC